MEVRNDFRKLLFPGITDEQDMAVGGLGGRINGLDDEWAAIDRLVLDGLLQFISEFIATHNPDDDGRIRVRKRFRRPLDELGKIVDERRLQPVFRQSGILRPDCEKRKAQYQEPGIFQVVSFCYCDKNTKNRTPRPADSSRRHRFSGHNLSQYDTRFTPKMALKASLSDKAILWPTIFRKKPHHA